MRAKITRGANIRGAIRYDLNEGDKSVEGKEAKLIGGNMTGCTVDDLATEFECIQKLRPDIQKPVWKEALRATKGEDISPEKWNEIAKDHMKNIGLDPGRHPYMITQHLGEDHVHILALRVAIDGKIYHGKNENLIASRDCQRLEAVHNLVRTSGAKYTIDEKGKHHIVMPERTKPRSNEIKMRKRTGEDPPRQRLQEILTVATKGRPTQQEFEKRLTAAGVSFKLSSNGYSYQLDGIPFKGSQLGTAYKWAQIQKFIVSPQEQARITQHAVWTAEQDRRALYRANSYAIKSAGRLAARVVPQPLGVTIQLAAELLAIAAQLYNWRQAHEYRLSVEKIKAKAARLASAKKAEAARLAQVQQVVVPASPAQSGALPPVIETTLPPQRPAVKPVAGEALANKITARPSIIAREYAEAATLIMAADPAKAKVLKDAAAALRNTSNARDITLPHPSASVAEMAAALKQEGIGGRTR